MTAIAMRPMWGGQSEPSPQYRGWQQLTIMESGKVTWQADQPTRKPWDHLAKRSGRWLKPTTLASEVKSALKRTTTIKGVKSMAATFPPPTKAQYRAWAKTETRSPAATFYDGTPQPGFDHEAHLAAMEMAA
jgi:hypothetical protein